MFGLALGLFIATAFRLGLTLPSFARQAISFRGFALLPSSFLALPALLGFRFLALLAGLALGFSASLLRRFFRPPALFLRFGYLFLAVGEHGLLGHFLGGFQIGEWVTEKIIEPFDVLVQGLGERHAQRLERVPACLESLDFLCREFVGTIIGNRDRAGICESFRCPRGDFNRKRLQLDLGRDCFGFGRFQDARHGRFSI